MSRRALVVVLAAAGVAAGVAVAVLLDAGGPQGVSQREAVLSRGRAIVVETRVTPRVALFGEPVTAEVTAVYNRGLVKERSLSVVGGFDPFEQIAPQRHTVSSDGALTRETWRYRLQCMTRRCLPGEPKRQVEFQQAQLQYTRLDPGNVLGPDSGRARASAIVDWPPLEIASRLAPDSTQSLTWRAETRALPPVTYRVGPPLATAVLFGGTGLLGAAAVLLLAPLAPRRRHAHAHVEEDEGATPLERTLALLEESRNGEVGDRRRTLELLARELHAGGHPDLADRATRLAWSREEPDPEEAAGLAGTVRAAIEAREHERLTVVEDAE